MSDAAPRVRLAAVTAPDGVLHVLGVHVEGAAGATHVSIGAGLLGDAFAATCCANDDELADLVAHAAPLDPTASTRRVEIVHFGSARLRPAELAGPFGERYEFAHADAPATLEGRAFLLASARVPGGPWVVAIGTAAEPSRLERATGAAGEAALFEPYRIAFADAADERFGVVDARVWCRELLNGREVVS